MAMIFEVVSPHCPYVDDAGRHADEAMEEIMRFAVTMSETGRARFVEAASHWEALRKAELLLRYNAEHSEWPEHDSATTVAKRNPLTNAHEGHKEFLRKYASITSSDCPAWDEAAGTVMMLTDPEMDEDVLVYPIRVALSDLPPEGDPLPGWKGGLSDELFPEYGKWTRNFGQLLMLTLLEKPEDRFSIPEGGFGYRWAVMTSREQVAGGGGCGSAQEAMEAAEAAASRHFTGDEGLGLTR